jgi:hypothetical protein
MGSVAQAHTIGSSIFNGVGFSHLYRLSTVLAATRQVFRTKPATSYQARDNHSQKPVWTFPPRHRFRRNRQNAGRMMQRVSFRKSPKSNSRRCACRARKFERDPVCEPPSRGQQ